MTFCARHVWRLALFLALACGYGYWLQDRAILRLELGVKDSAKYQVYWAGAHEQFAEERSASFRVFPKVRHYAVYLGKSGNIGKIRIDPGEGIGKSRLIVLKLHQKGFRPLVVRKPDELSGFQPLNDVAESWVDKDGLWVISSGPDPYLAMDISPRPIPGAGVHDYAPFVLFLLIACLPYQRLVELELGYVPYCLILVLVLVGILAGLGRFNKHPDEYVHYQAAKYYENHWRPPWVCEAGTKKSYSIYGVSRLNAYEAAYPIAGKFAGLGGFLPINGYIRARFFNVVLLAILAILALKAVKYRALFLPLLISPQIWYLFGYFNSDAFAIFILFIFSYLLVDENSILMSYLKEPNFTMPQVLKGVACGILLSMLILLKMNYYVYIVFLTGYGAIAVFTGNVELSRTLIKKAGAVVLIAISIVTLRMAWDFKVNGLDKSEKLLECREKLAREIYKPSRPLHEQAVVLKMKARGVPFGALFSQNSYFERFFQSAVGVYGYTEIHAQPGYYHLMLALISVLAMIGLGYGFRSPSMEVKLLTALTLVCALLIIAASVWRSWTVVFQPQGRYMFVILPMVGIVLQKMSRTVNSRAFTFFTLLLFSASVYSFIWIGMIHLPMIH